MATAPDNRSFIQTFFDDFEERCQFVTMLLHQERGIEATILCCAYIEGIANNMYPESKDSARNFSAVLADHGDDAFLTAIHPTFLFEALPRTRKVDQDALALLQAALQNSNALCQPQDIFLLLGADTAPETLESIRCNLWRGSIANLAYVHIRSAMFKRGLGSSSISFSGQTYAGAPAPSLTTERLSVALAKVLVSARDLSLTTNKWYGTIG